MAVTKVAMIAQKAVAAKSRSARADRKLGISVGTLRGGSGGGGLELPASPRVAQIFHPRVYVILIFVLYYSLEREDRIETRA